MESNKTIQKEVTDIKFEKCGQGDCEDWLTNMTVYTTEQSDQNSILFFEAELSKKKPVDRDYSIADATTKVTLFIANSNQSDQDQTEMFGCRWLPKNPIGQPGDCESAISNQYLKDWHNFSNVKGQIALQYNTSDFTWQTVESQIKRKEGLISMKAYRSLSQQDINKSWKLGEKKKLFIRVIYGDNLNPMQMRANSEMIEFTLNDNLTNSFINSQGYTIIITISMLCGIVLLVFGVLVCIFWKYMSKKDEGKIQNEVSPASGTKERKADVIVDDMLATDRPMNTQGSEKNDIEQIGQITDGTEESENPDLFSKQEPKQKDNQQEKRLYMIQKKLAKEKADQEFAQQNKMIQGQGNTGLPDIEI